MNINTFYKSYNPITAAPYKCTEDYMEFAPCKALRPYIRCFWGSGKIITQRENTIEETSIVIPDTCMDLIFAVDFTHNKIEASFCGMDDRTFTAQKDGTEEKTYFIFAVRFYPWSAALFAEDSLRGTKNAFWDADRHFPTIKKEIEQHLFDVTDLFRFIPVAEKILQSHLTQRHQSETVFRAVSGILEKRGNISVTALEREVFVGSRQLQRLFLEHIGVAPKSLANMVRYQYIWNELLYNQNFHTAETAYRYGYADQSHLCHDFKKYHSMSMADAKQYARQHTANMETLPL